MAEKCPPTRSTGLCRCLRINITATKLHPCKNLFDFFFFATPFILTILTFHILSSQLTFDTQGNSVAVINGSKNDTNTARWNETGGGDNDYSAMKIDAIIARLHTRMFHENSDISSQRTETLNPQDDALTKLQLISRRNSTALKASNVTSFREKATNVPARADVFWNRQKRVIDTCQRHKLGLPGKVHKVYSNPVSGALYCPVPGIGLALWEKYFSVAERKNRTSGTNTSSTTQEDKPLHRLKGPHASSFNLTLHSFEKFPTRLIVVEDPYSRLLTSYLDKVYLPEFWPTEVKAMVGKIKHRRQLFGTASKRYNDRDVINDSGDFLRQHFNHIANIQQFSYKLQTNETKSSTETEYLCGKYLTFAQFVVYGFDRDEPHWTPIHQLCQPCEIGVTHVSTVDTLHQDASALFGKIGGDAILENMDERMQVDDEIERLIKINFNKVHSSEYSDFYKHCLTNRELAFRLWQSFIWKGFIDSDIRYVIPNADDLTTVVPDLIDQIKQALTNGRKHQDRMKTERTNFIKRIFQTMPKKLLKMIDRKYKIDFELFDFESKIIQFYDSSREL